MPLILQRLATPLSPRDRAGRTEHKGVQGPGPGTVVQWPRSGIPRDQRAQSTWSVQLRPEPRLKAVDFAPENQTQESTTAPELRLPASARYQRCRAGPFRPLSSDSESLSSDSETRGADSEGSASHDCTASSRHSGWYLLR
eukprot:3141618-Rhodomonas_salina.3